MIIKETIISEKCPNLILGILSGGVKIANTGDEMRNFIFEKLKIVQSERELETVSQYPTIRTTRDAYRTLGKKPGRYRPSAEALTRRILQGKGLYDVNNFVNCLNLISVLSGYSIGGYDFDKIRGQIRLGKGDENEPYDAIGRGELNIHNLPILRDDLGAFGSPTSDSVRTMITEKTSKFLMVFFNFGGHKDLECWTNESKKLLGQFASGRDFKFYFC